MHFKIILTFYFWCGGSPAATFTKNKKQTPMYYRVFDQQTGTYFATGYNSSSIEELINDFRSYLNEDYEEQDENFRTWDQLADHLQEVILEENETPFEELD